MRWTSSGAMRKKVVPVFITVDPARDTPEVLKDYLAAFGPEFVGLTGTDDVDRAGGEGISCLFQGAQRR